MSRWFFEGLEQRVGRSQGQPIRLINDADLSTADKGPVDDLRLEIPDLLDLDLGVGLFLVRFDQQEVRVGTSFDLMTGPAGSTGVGNVRTVVGVSFDRLR